MQPRRNSSPSPRRRPRRAASPSTRFPTCRRSARRGSAGERAGLRAEPAQRAPPPTRPTQPVPTASRTTDGLWNSAAARGRRTTAGPGGVTQGFLPGLFGTSPNTRRTSPGGSAPTRGHGRWTSRNNMRTHDMGFSSSAGHGEAYGRRGTRTTARWRWRRPGSLASRYNPRVGIISCCDWNTAWQLPLVTDTMVDLELLFWGATQNQLSEPIQGQEGWRDMALNHALTTLRDMVRASPDGSTYHVIDYDPATGTSASRRRSRARGQRRRGRAGRPGPCTATPWRTATPGTRGCWTPPSG